MLRGRRLPLPQPALPGWSSKPPSALTAARFFCSTARRPDNHGRDPRDLFFNLRQQVSGETEAKQRANEESAQRNQPAKRANVDAGQKASTKPSEKPREETAQSGVPNFEKELEEAPGELVYPRRVPPKRDEISAKTSPASHGKRTKGDHKPEKAGSFFKRIFQSPHDPSKSEDAKTRNLRALARQTRVDTGAKSRAHATTNATGKGTRQAQLEAENKASLLTPKDAADESGDKVQSSPLAKNLDSKQTAADKALGPNFFQQVDLFAPLLKFRRVTTDPSQREQPKEEKSTRPPKNAETVTPRKEERREGEGNSAKSIFEMLFQEDVSKKQKSTPMGSMLSRSNADEFIPDVAKPSHSAGSIYDMLFPKEPEDPEWEPEGTEAKESQEALTLPEDSILVSLRNEVRNWIPPEEQDEIKAPKPREYGSHSTVITIRGVSSSLIETDFYRIIPESKHVEGWAGGLVKVVQARDSLSQRPLGRYYLMFHSRPAAIIYAEEARRLHALSQKLLHPSGTGLSPARCRLNEAPLDPQPFISEEEKAAVGSFTLCSPSIPLNLKIDILTTDVLREIAAHGVVADVVQALRSEADTPAKVLITVTLPGGGSPEPSKYGLTTGDLWLTLRDDGRERSAPWLLANLAEGIMPVKIRAGGRKKLEFKAEAVKGQLGLDDSGAHDHDEDEDMPGTPTAKPSSSAPESNSTKDKNDGKADGMEQDAERYNRFILTFKHRQHARRFVRCWHKRTIHDAEMERHVVIDAVALI